MYQKLDIIFWNFNDHCGIENEVKRAEDRQNQNRQKNLYDFQK